MKKVYNAPQILFESFVMSTSVAANCESMVNNPTKGNCAVISSGGINIFDGTVTGEYGCMFTPEGMGQEPDTWDGFCYHTPTEYTNLFNS